jgi:hypothetical protein
MHLGLRAGHKLTAEVCQQAQMLLNEGLELPEVGRRVGFWQTLFTWNPKLLRKADA